MIPRTHEVFCAFCRRSGTVTTLEKAVHSVGAHHLPNKQTRSDTAWPGDTGLGRSFTSWIVLENVPSRSPLDRFAAAIGDSFCAAAIELRRLPKTTPPRSSGRGPAAALPAVMVVELLVGILVGLLVGTLPRH